MNTLEIVDELKARTSFSDRDSAGIARVIVGAIDDRVANLVTRDHLDARMAEQRADFERLRADFAGLRGDFEHLRGNFEGLRGDLHQTLRAQTIWITATMLTASAVVVAVVKLV